MINRFLLIGLLACCSFMPAAAQQTRVLTIEEMFSLADENSKSLKVHDLAVSEAVEAVRAAKSERLPSVEAGLSFSYIGDGWMCDRDFSNGMHADMPHFGNNFAFKATQAVYAGGAISAGIALGELQQGLAQAEFDSDRQNVRLMLVGYYLDLYQLANQRKVYEKNIEQTEMLIEEIRSAFEQGTALMSDITRYELQLKNMELGLTHVVNSMKIINYKLATTIGLSPDTVIVPDTALLDVPVDSKDMMYWQQVREEAPVMRIADMQVELSRQQQNVVKAGGRPKIGLVAANNFDGPILIEVPPINQNFNYWYVGVNISFSFDAFYKNSKKVRQSGMAVLKAQENRRLVDEQLSSEIHAAYVNLEEAYTQLDTYEKSVQLAHESYEVIHSRYINGLSLVTDMLEASNIQLSSELELANAQVGVLYRYFVLRKTVGEL